MKNLSFRFQLIIIFLFIIQGCETPVTSDGTTKTQNGNREVQEKTVQSSNKDERFVKGELIVRFKESVTNQEIEEIISSIGARTIKTVSKERKTVLILLPENLSIDDAINELSKWPDILYAEPNRIYKLEGE